MDKPLKIKRSRRASLDKRRARAGYFFVAPFIIGIILIYLPILIDSVWLSFHEQVNANINGTNVTVLEFRGLEYYKYAFTESPEFPTKLLAGLQQLVFEVPAVIIFSLFIAVVLNQKMLGRAAFRAILFVPVIISTGLMESINGADIMSDNMSEGIQDGSGGAGGGIVDALMIENLFKSMAIGGELVGYVVGLVNDIYNIIHYSGVQMLIFLAGLQSISDTIYEACRIDGATAWETFWKVTFPMISPMILVNAVYSVIDAFTRSSNVTMSFIKGSTYNDSQSSAMYWIYFGVVILIIAAVAGIASTFIFYQRRD